MKTGSFIGRIKIFPLLMVVGTLSLGVRGTNIYNGYNVLSQPAVAQDTQQTDEEQGGDNADAGDTADTTTAQAPARPAPMLMGVPSDEEMELITQLRQRREELEKRSVAIDLQEQLLASTEKRINDKILQLQVLEERIKDHLRLFEEREATQLQSIVKVYETMKPKQAAPRFEALQLQTQLDLVTRMKPSKVAALMSQMSTRAASRLTTELATMSQPPAIEEMDGTQ